MEKIIKIKEVELGKPDAKDEFLYGDSLKEFCDKLILPPNFDVRNLVDKEKCYIIGNKGVGKTALLFYINNMLLERDPLSECSMILFKSQISASDRAIMDKVEKMRISNMSIADNELKYVRDFTKLWTLVIYKKIIEDNEKSDIYEKDINWKSFESLILRLDNKKAGVLKFVSEIPENSIHFSVEQGAYISNVPKVKYPKDESDTVLANFYEAITFADKLFCSLKKKDHKYYLCIDELEAYNCNRDIYIRDLTMIRDLIITTKRINSLLRENKIKNVKIILSVRTEMIRSISRELPGLEYNKDLEGFSEKINWSAPKIEFIYHPLSSVWLKRIQESLNKRGKSQNTSAIYENMFPKVIGIDNTIDFVIDRTWQKPRDIVRLMSCLYNTVDKNTYFYEAKDFVKAMSEYSRQSKDELIEELGAMYSNKEIDKIFAALIAFKKHFTKEELIERLNTRVIFYYKQLDANKIIDDLYRIGVLGQINFSTDSEIWGYLGKVSVEDENWRYMVHRGLWSEFELEKEAYEGILYTDIVGLPCQCEVKGRQANYLQLSFAYGTRTLKGMIHAKDIDRRYVDLNKYIGKTMNAIVIGYNSRQRLWELSKMTRKII